MAIMKLFAGSSNPKLAQKISEKLTLPLGQIDSIRFADGEARVRIIDNDSEEKVAVIQSLSNPADSYLMELALIGDALKSQDVEKMIAVIPYLGYSRQDRSHRPGEAISARVVAKLIQAAGFTKVITVDLHSESVAGFYHHIPVVNLTALSLCASILPKGEDIVIVSPDAGGMKRAQKFAQEVDCPLVFVEKKRDLAKIHTTKVVRVVGDVKEKIAVIIDDTITSGGTLVQATFLLIQHGAKKVIAFATHADFVSATRTILSESPLERIYVTDTIAIKKEWQFSKLTVLSVTDLIAQAIK